MTGPIPTSPGLTTREVVIEAGRGEDQYWRDVWQYRELLFFLAWRDLLVRYKQTALGVAWALLRPLVGLVAFTVVFGKLAALPSGGLPYPVLVLAGLVPWLFFAAALTDASNSLVANASLVSKVYFPRLLAPLSAVAVSLVDLAISGAMLGALLAFYRQPLTPRLLALPAFLLLALVAALGAGLWLAALHVRYRDVRHVVPFLLQVGLYLSPVGFTSALIPDRWRAAYALNPMVGVIEGFRWCLLGPGSAAHWGSLTASAAMATLLLLSGVWYFRRTERTFADLI
jgi:lipopolysaccharide transport system permease protein